MKTKAVRLYGKSDLRLEEFELPEMKDDEILAKVVSDSLLSLIHIWTEPGCFYRTPCGGGNGLFGHDSGYGGNRPS